MCKGCGNRLILEADLLKTNRTGNVFQFVFGSGIAGGVIVAKMHRTPHYHF